MPLQQNQPITTHAFTDAVNFANYLKVNNLNEGEFKVFGQIKNAAGALETTCCNLPTFSRILKEIYISTLETNKENTALWTALKIVTKTERLMFFEGEKQILSV